MGVEDLLDALIVFLNDRMECLNEPNVHLGQATTALDNGRVGGQGLGFLRQGQDALNHLGAANIVAERTSGSSDYRSRQWPGRWSGPGISPPGPRRAQSPRGCEYCGRTYIWVKRLPLSTMAGSVVRAWDFSARAKTRSITSGLRILRSEERRVGKKRR